MPYDEQKESDEGAILRMHSRKMESEEATISKESEGKKHD